MVENFNNVIFDNDLYRRSIINALRKRKGLSERTNVISNQDRKEKSYNRLAQTVKNSLNMDLVYKIVGVK